MNGDLLDFMGIQIQLKEVVHVNKLRTYSKTQMTGNNSWEETSTKILSSEKKSGGNIDRKANE